MFYECDIWHTLDLYILQSKMIIKQHTISYARIHKYSPALTRNVKRLDASANLIICSVLLDKSRRPAQKVVSRNTMTEYTFESTRARVAQLWILYRVDCMLKQDCRAISAGLSLLYNQGETLRSIGTRAELEAFQVVYRTKLDALDEVMALLQRINHLKRRISIEEFTTATNSRFYWRYERNR